MKLWTVSVEFDYICLAENAQQASYFAGEAARDLGSLGDYAYATEYKGYVPSGWGRNDLIYHGDRKNDITVGEAIDMISAA